MASDLTLFALGDLSPAHEAHFTSNSFRLTDPTLLHDKDWFEVGEGTEWSVWLDDLCWLTYRAPVLDQTLFDQIIALHGVFADTAGVYQFLVRHMGERIYGAWI